jgi:amino acid adenylation domain-containing protein
MSVRNIEDIYRLSPMQQGMLFHSLYAPETGAYFEQASWTLRGDLNVTAFEKAWQTAVNRHTALRTAFMWEDLEEPLQVVYRNVDVPIKLLNWQEMDDTVLSAKLTEFLEADRAEGFHLSEPPLIRLTLIQTGKEVYKFILSNHHLLMDGWSQPIIFRDVLLHYEAYSQGNEVTLLQPPRPYRDYIAWLQKQDMSAAQMYWQNTLRGFLAPTPLPNEHLAGYPIYSPGDIKPESDNNYGLYYHLFDQTLSDQLQDQVQRSQLTLNTLVQGAWALLLSQYSGEQDVLFGSTVSGRPPDLPGSDSIVGLFINTIPTRVQVNPDQRVIDWLQELQKQQVASRQYEYAPLVDIQSWSEVSHNLPLFNSLLIFENYPLEDVKQGGRSRISLEQGDMFTRTNYPLTIAFSPGKRIGLEIGYEFNHVSKFTVKGLVDHLTTLLAQMTTSMNQQIGELSILRDDDVTQILVEWNDTERDFQNEKCVHQLFEDRANRSPDWIALRAGDREVTYDQLNRRANQLSHYLRKLEVGSDTLVGVSIERSVDMIVAVLGVLKAGAAYIPLDPFYPSDRLRLMIDDSGLDIILTHEKLNTDHLANQNKVVLLDSNWQEINQESDSNPDIQFDLDSLAYVIYTSGSTGIPKGVAVTHRSLVNHVLTMSKIVETKADDRVLMFISLNFDASAETIYPTLINGASLVLPDVSQDLLGGEILRYIDKHKITILHIPVPIWQHSVDALNEEDIAVPATLRLLHVGGELIAVDKLNFWCEKVGERGGRSSMALVNSYGPTEATITTTVFKSYCDQATIAQYPRIPIGRPISNVKIYILDERMKPVPVGTPGEIFIGGIGLARGYLNRPQETAINFITDPFNNRTGARLYKTGDVARYLPDGNIEFLGRVDFQVKLRGFRVELGEIETVLRQINGIKDVVAEVRDDDSGDKQLIAYYILDGSSEREISTQEMRDFLEERLPNYMIPAVIMHIQEIPLTPSGKIDRRALPTPDGVRPGLFNEYVQPRTAVEEIVAGHWSDVLGVDRVGIKDNFYDLGGHSLKATQIISRMRQTFNVDIPIRTLFETPTVEGVAGQIEITIEGGDVDQAVPLMSALQRDETTGLPVVSPPLSFSQQRLWFLDQLDPGNLAWNIPIFVRIDGSLVLDALELSLQSIVQRHEVLRTTFLAVDGQPVQEIHSDLRIPLNVTVLSSVQVSLDDPSLLDQKIQTLGKQEVQKTFDLENGPLIRARVLQINERDHILILTLHHIIADGWSLSILVKELALLYQVYINLRKSGVDLSDPTNVLDLIDSQVMEVLPDMPIQYADYSVWQRSWLREEALEQQLDYWRNQLANNPPILDLPTDRPRPALKSSFGAAQKFVLPEALAKNILELCRQEGVTPYMFLLAVYQTLLFRYSGQEDLPIGTAIANRTRWDIEGLIGFFVNTLVMRGDLSGNPKFRELLIRTRDVALGAYAHQDLPFEMLVEELSPERNLSYSPLFQVGFDFQDNPVDALHFPELTLRPIEISRGTTPYDLLLSITHTRDDESGIDYLGGALDYNTDLYDRTTIERMISHFELLLKAIVENLDINIATVPILTQEEFKDLIVNWNATDAKYPTGQTIHQRFEYQVEKQPDAVAITYEGINLTYDELNRKANQLAHYLCRRGVRDDVLVGVSTDRSPEMIIGILGVLKAGGAFLPLDPTYPAERLAFMIEDSEISLLLTKEDIIAHIPQAHEMIMLDRDWAKIEIESELNPDPVSSAENLAYMIYTSGSTGKPKGAMLEHGGLCNLAEAQRIEFNIDHRKKVLQFSPFSFDASVWETFMALANGGTLCLARQETLASGIDLIRLLKREGITTVTLPPSLLSVLPEEISSESLPDLETVIAAGEACTQEIVSRWAPGRKFYNAYGPTETTVCASIKLCNEKNATDPPIGRPIANTKLYILDKNLQPVPIGVPGELMVGGVSLSRGYLNRPEMTAEKFIPHPFPDRGRGLIKEKNDKLYRTGDLARYRTNGDIEYLGRIDYQVKLRGHRIELGEIETTLRGITDIEDIEIQEAVVLVREDVPGDQRIVAYLTFTTAADQPENHGSVASALRNALSDSLPEYMVPAAYVILDSMPLSPAGKVDRKALAKLPAPEVGRQELTAEFVEPSTPLEEQLSVIVAEILGIEKIGEKSPIGVHDNFFVLGGHSLLATQFLSRVRDTFNVELPLRTLFEHPTVAELSMDIEILEQRGVVSPPAKIQRVSRESRRIKRSLLDIEE